MCFTPAFVVFLPFAPILGVWGGSLFYANKASVEAMASRGVYTASLGTAPQLGGALASILLGGGLWAAQRRAIATFRDTTTSILNNHDLDLRDVWRSVRPSNFSQDTARERLPAVQDSITSTMRRHAPAVARLTASGTASLVIVGALQPVAAAALAGSDATSSPPAGASLRRKTTGERTRDLREAFQREIAASKLLPQEERAEVKQQQQQQQQQQPRQRQQPSPPRIERQGGGAYGDEEPTRREKSSRRAATAGGP